jgi:hypothetical protein
MYTGGEKVDEEELTAQYDEMKETALNEHLSRTAAEIARYKMIQICLRDWYDDRKAKL